MIDELDVVRSGGMTTLFGGVYEPLTVGTCCGRSPSGAPRQLESVLRERVAAVCTRVDLLPGAGQRVSTRCCGRCTAPHEMAIGTYSEVLISQASNLTCWNKMRPAPPPRFPIDRLVTAAAFGTGLGNRMFDSPAPNASSTWTETG